MAKAKVYWERIATKELWRAWLWQAKTFVVVSGKPKAMYGYALGDAEYIASQKRKGLSEQKLNV